PLHTPLVTAADGAVRGAGWTVDADYLCLQARQPVRFDLAMAGAVGQGCQDFVEIGAGNTLAGLGRYCAPESRWTGGQGDGDGTAVQLHGLLTALGSLYRRGAELDWRALTRGGGRVSLPGHPLRRRPVAATAPAPATAPATAPRTLPPPSASKAPVVPGELLAEVRALTADKLGMAVADVTPDNSFFEFGADSLSLMGMTAELEQRHGVRVPVRELFDSADTPRRLAERLAQLAGAAPAPVPPPRTARVAPLPMSPAAPAAPRPMPAAPATTTAPAPGCDFSLYFFGDYPEDAERDKYALIMAAAEFADQHGFHALWFPERHFNSFGALFPNPSVLAAALAGRTSRIRLHAGSVVLPLHHPVRVAEEWSVVDNISGGRAGLCLASGWHATDFALAPQHFGRHREVMYEQLATLRQLWSGRPLAMTAGDGEPVEVRLHPRPLQERLPLYVAVVGNPDSYRRAAAEDLGVVTNLMTQTVEQLAENIALYRRTRAEHGFDPAAGRVVVLVHTYLGDDAQRARAEAYRPFVSYLRSSLSLFDQVTNSLGFELDLDSAPEEDVEFLLGRAYERYCDSRALIGDERDAAGTVRRLVAAGVDEISCFVDFGVPTQQVLAALPVLDRVRRREQSTAREQAAPVPERMPLSPAQRRIWFLEQLHPGTSMYHEPKAIRLDGPLNVEALRWALRRVAERHPALRTVFGVIDGVPYRETLDRTRLECPIEDHGGATEEEALRATLETEGRRLLDLNTGPLVRARLLRLSEERHVLFLLVHHIVFDSSSTVVLVHDLAAHYRSWPHGEPALPHLAEAPPYDRRNPAELAESLAFWRRELSGVPQLSLPTDRPRPPVRSGAGASLTHELAAELVDRVRTFAAAHRATLFMTLISAIGAVLGRFSGQQDVVLGTAVAARPAGAEHHVGLFLDTVALRLDLTGDPDFPTLLHRVRQRSTAAYEHRGVPFDELVGALNPRRDPSRNPLFQVMVEYENEGEVDFAPPRLTATLLDMPSARAPFDLSAYLTHHRDGVRFMVEYDTALFDESTVRRFVDYVEQTLRRALDAPGAPLGELTAVTGVDRDTLARLGHQEEQLPAPEDT
ncbi:MupA/Atu3671 family FMN-dependent luciferase-like monooxygenase, partial [Streptomyces sp. 2MCAF27]